MKTITTAVPAALWPAYVELRRAVSPDESTADQPPNGIPSWQRDGVEYVASSMPRQDWHFAALDPLTEPEWGADMALAQQAQAALAVWPGDAEEPGDPPLAQPDAITVLVGIPGRDALAAMGLERVADEAWEGAEARGNGPF